MDYTAIGRTLKFFKNNNSARIKMPITVILIRLLKVKMGT